VVAEHPRIGLVEVNPLWAASRDTRVAGSQENSPRLLFQCRAMRAKRASAALVTALVAWGVALLLVGAPSNALAQAAPSGCSDGRLTTAKGCESPGAVSGHLDRILRGARDEFGLKAVIVRVDAGRRTLLREALGQSQSDVPANPRMHFRIGSMAIPWLTTVVLQLRDEGRLSLNDRISRWFPNLPRAGQVTVRMLANNTGGYYDYIQGYQPFIDLLYANVFRRWRPSELLNTALSRGFACDPGTCFNYAHTNYILLARIVQKVTGQTMTNQMNRRIARPLGLGQTQFTSKATIPGPVLHAFTSERGVYEDSTTWSPSWTIGSGTIATSTIDDIATAAPAIFSGRLLSRSSRRQLVAPSTAGLPPFSKSTYYALGLIVGNGWRIQNPSLNGYSGVMAYLPQGKLSIALTATNTKAASLAERNFSEPTFARLAGYLAPGHPAPFAP
jgi:D-alanyl-D-alanine carboxypeptidase